MLGFAQAGDGFDPAEDLHDALTFALADGISVVPRRAFIDRTGAMGMFVLGHMWCRLDRAQRRHQLPRVIVLIAPDRDAPLASGHTPRHHPRRLALGFAGRL